MKINRFVLGILLTFGSYSSAFAQKKMPDELLLSLNPNSNDTIQSRILLKLCAYYIYKPDEYKADLDSAEAYLNFARKRLKMHTSGSLEFQKHFLFAELTFERKRKKEGMALYSALYQSCQRAKDIVKQAWIYYNWAYRVDSSGEGAEESMPYFEKALALYSIVGYRQRELELAPIVINMATNKGRFDLAERSALQLLKLTKKENTREHLLAYETLADANDLKGSYNRALEYGLKMVDYFLTLPGQNQERTAFYYYKLSKIYLHMHLYDESLVWLNKGLHLKSPYKASYVVGITNIMLKQNKAQQALAFILKNLDSLKNQDQQNNRIVARSIAECNFATKNYVQAERYFLKMERLLIASTADPRSQFDTYLPLARFYNHQKKFAVSERYLSKLWALPHHHIPLQAVSQLHLIQYQIDSAKGNYFSSIGHLKKYKDISDSLFNADKSRQISELEIKYETKQKNNELKLQSENIKLLTKQSDLQSQQIKSAEITKRLTVSLILLLILLVALFFNRYRYKRRLAAKLQQSEFDLHKKNTALEQLLEEKDILIDEKEWLMKEIHHRVKNNLQIITSLLNLQSGYLENNEALMAVKESQNRMFAMSLIHNKLYQQQNVGLIFMPDYINELAEYLDEGLNIHNSIIFKLKISAIELDSCYAAPLGLLINEIVTNSVKHAFTGGDRHVISINLMKLSNQKVLLDIWDNGRGIEKDVDFLEAKSMGVSLIRILVRQMEGEISVSNNPGLRMKIEFQVSTEPELELNDKNSLKRVLYD